MPPLLRNTLMKTTPKGFEPSRVEPNGFLVHLLNHSDTVSSANLKKLIVCPDIKISNSESRSTRKLVIGGLNLWLLWIDLPNMSGMLESAFQTTQPHCLLHRMRLSSISKSQNIPSVEDELQLHLGPDFIKFRIAQLPLWGAHLR